MEREGGRVLSFTEILTVLRYRGIYMNLLAYFVVLIPLILLLNAAARRLDERLGLPPLFDAAVGMPLFIILTCCGLALVWWSYAYLCLLGEGSPSPHLGGTRRLVREGPYSAVRHPSVLGKLLGVLGVGCLFASPSFLLGMVPLLLLYSLVYNRFFQEAGCVKRFGGEYLAYRTAVPFIVPSPGKVRALLGTRPAAQWAISWVLVITVLLQILQLWTMVAARRAERFVFMPVSFTQSGGGGAGKMPVLHGPAALGPTITLEDLVRGLVVMEEHPERGLALDARQRATVRRLLGEASLAREEVLAQGKEIFDGDARLRALAGSMLGSLSAAQARYVSAHKGDGEAGPTVQSWERLLRRLEGKAGDR